ncbi:ParB/RepB/Spo0J family partition protein [uncultured Erythrobacter sp.]|uniref:ParB/RepB/Spo0J family partition protein n=1 Tax=uncultured Erythrobacter sp. TaxID=263913 RepID=UPI0026131977|nr:ParB/RepB/Spo0J family partition protein [uncultured Erythrobacter sp.]
MELHHIPLDHLKVSALNMRHSRRKPDVSDILPSIRQRGIIQPLLVKPNGKPDHYDIYAGRRRFFAMKSIAKDADSNPVLPCLILDKNEDVDAVEASILENTARVGPDEMEQYEAFKRLADKGRDVTGIAETFGVTELTVKRRLALANLLPAIRKAFADDEIDGRTVTALTLATEARQAEWLALHQSDDEYAPTGQRLKAWLCGGEHITTDKAIFPLEDYSGAVLSDLFGEHGVFADADLFWSHQNAAVASLRDAYVAKGWADCNVLDRGRYFERWNHVKAAKKEGGKIFIELRDSGDVMVHEGYITEAEHRRRQKKAMGDDDSTTPSPKPELTNPAQTYVELHRHAAVRAALLSAPAVALRLTVAHMIGGSALWQTRAEPQVTRKDETADSVAGSAAQAAFDAEQVEILARLGFEAHGHSVTRSNGDDWRVAETFAKLIALTDDEVMRILTFVMAETLQSGTCVVEQIGCHLAVDMTGSYAPDDAFFDLVRSKAAVNAILAEIGGKAVADANVSATTKVQKGILRDFMTGENGRAKAEGWLPGYFRFPLETYTPGGAGRLTENARKAAHLASPPATD